MSTVIADIEAVLEREDLSPRIRAFWQMLLDEVRFRAAR